ncbi:hypothetical protein BaRGS_00001918 [Batillaria attramentaria]|uniref:Uncharacterized protein n=1 Tax=Batillaria attramentaria TaxID=370345 RepID=A0ABD0M6D1_9CAEN
MPCPFRELFSPRRRTLSQCNMTSHEWKMTWQGPREGGVCRHGWSARRARVAGNWLQSRLADQSNLRASVKERLGPGSDALSKRFKVTRQTTRDVLLIIKYHARHLFGL